MKTKDLIAELQQQDPSGELECVVGGEDIYFCERQEYYYDGTPTLLVRDESKKPYYHIVGLRVPGSGEKVRLHTMSVEDVFLDHPEAPVSYETEQTRTRNEPSIEAARADIKKILEDKS